MQFSGKIWNETKIHTVMLNSSFMTVLNIFHQFYVVGMLSTREQAKLSSWYCCTVHHGTEC